MSEPEAESEPADAIAIFRPKHRAMILPFLDLDPEGGVEADSEREDNSDGFYAEELEDGSFLVHTFQPFEVFDDNPKEARLWLQQFGVALSQVHDDPRGLLFFPDDNEPDDAATYDAIVKAIGDDGLWVSLTEVLEDEDDEVEPADQAMRDLQQLLGRMTGGDGAAPTLDMGMLQKLAGQLMGGADPNAAPEALSSFDMGQMFEQMQRGIVETMTAGTTDPTEPGEVIDEEFAPDPKKTS